MMLFDRSIHLSQHNPGHDVDLDNNQDSSPRRRGYTDGDAAGPASTALSAERTRRKDNVQYTRKENQVLNIGNMSSTLLLRNYLLLWFPLTLRFDHHHLAFPPFFF